MGCVSSKKTPAKAEGEGSQKTLGLVEVAEDEPDGDALKDMAKVVGTSRLEARSSISVNKPKGLDLGEFDLVAFDNLKVEEKIGEGCFGVVLRGFLWGQEVALKVVKVPRVASFDDMVREFNKECTIMKELRHPNVVSFMGACVDPPKFIMITEWVSGGTLKAQIRKGAFAMERVIQVSLDVARGMTWLHHKNIIHRDLKPDNLLIDQHRTIKICDFGLSLVKETLRDEKLANVGTPTYMAPEVLRGDLYGEKCDVWSFGVILVEMVSGKYPYGHKMYQLSSHSHDLKIAQGTKPIVPERASQLNGLPDLIHACQREPSHRPTFDEIIATLGTIKANTRETFSKALDSVDATTLALLQENALQIFQLETALAEVEAKLAQERATNEKLHAMHASPLTPNMSLLRSMDDGEPQTEAGSEPKSPVNSQPPVVNNLPLGKLAPLLTSVPVIHSPLISHRTLENAKAKFKGNATAGESTSPTTSATSSPSVRFHPALTAIPPLVKSERESFEDKSKVILDPHSNRPIEVGKSQNENDNAASHAKEVVTVKSMMMLQALDKHVQPVAKHS